MCGIAGAIEGPGSDVSPVLRRMAARLSHRGPDDAGVAAWPASGAGLAHQRLSIIDLSEAGHQPMATAGGSVSIVFNGEIYNFRELREELTKSGAFRSQSDTEVIVRAYEEWGIDCLSRLRGMFAFAIWDDARKRLLLARDRLGLKPLYYAQAGAAIVFASEPKALLAHPAVSARLDRSALADYLTYGYVPFDRSIFEGIRKLPAGHALVYEGGGARVFAYWTFAPDGAGGGPSPSDLRGALADAVRAHAIADVPVGAFLSGGIDSSVVTALLSADAASPVRTIAVGFDEGPSELPFAREVAERYRTSHREEHVTSGGVDTMMQTLARVYDEPLADPSTVPTYLLCGAARRSVKVAISGDGGDELFAGYGRYGRMLRPLFPSVPAAGIVRAVRRLPPLARLQLALRQAEPDVARRYQLHVGLFDDYELGRAAGPALQPVLRERDPLWLFRKFLRPDLPLLTALQWLDVKTYLADDILVKVDRASMAHSLEVRPPILDHHVVELAFRIPAPAQRDAAGGKAFLKNAISDLVPASILARSKQGFSPPTTKWFKSALWPVARDRIVNGMCVRDGWIDRTFVDAIVANRTERRWYKVWSLWVLEEWYRAWIGEPT